jgi:anti-anti-sigma regulatory factor
MNVRITGETVRVTGLRQLGGDDALILRAELEEALETHCHRVEVDLSQTDGVDSSGLGVLVSAWMVCGRVRLLNTPPLIRQFLDLTRQRQKFELAQS